MEITFLGTGAAVAANGYNVSMLIDRVLLLDAGAPLPVHLPRAGVSVTEPRAALLTHFHADHTFGLAGLVLARTLLEEMPPPLTIVGPDGTQEYMTQLIDFAWGPEMLQAALSRRQLEVREIGPGDEIDLLDFRVSAFEMKHTSRFTCLGYVVAANGIRLGYSGDAETSPGLEALLGNCDHAVVEMTTERPGPMHLSCVEVEELLRRHPSVRFILTHLGTDVTVSGALSATDFLTVQLPMPAARGR